MIDLTSVDFSQNVPHTHTYLFDSGGVVNSVVVIIPVVNCFTYYRTVILKQGIIIVSFEHFLYFSMFFYHSTVFFVQAFPVQ